MSRFFRRVGRFGVKTAGVCVCAVGTAKLGMLAINDDLDDVSYFFKKIFRKPAERKKVVVLGSGWGALSFATKLDAELYEVTIISPRPFFFYTPLLCGSVTGLVSPGAIIESIRNAAHGCTFVNAACRKVDLDSKKVACSGIAKDSDFDLDYDHLVVAVGAQPNTFGIPGVDKHAFFLKEMEQGRSLRKHILNRLEAADVAIKTGDPVLANKLLSIIVVGGGPTGVEFCGEMADFIKKDLTNTFPNLKEHFSITLIEALPGLLTMFQKVVGQHVQEHLTRQGVDVRLNAMMKEAEEDRVHIKNKDGSIEAIEYGTLLWVGGVCMRPFTNELCQTLGPEAGQTDRRGLLVDDCLRVKGTTPGEVFAIGDCAVSGKPPTAQVASQQGKFLGRMFREGSHHLITDPTAPGFAYYHQGSMAYIGDSKAVAEVFPKGLLKLGTSSITDHMIWRSLYGEADHVRMLGTGGFTIWRSAYFSRFFSERVRWSVASDWLRTTFFGRPAASSEQGTADLSKNVVL